VKVLLVAETLTPQDGWGSVAAGLTRGLTELGVRTRAVVGRDAKPEVPPGCEVIPCLSLPGQGLVHPHATAWNAAQLLRHARGADVLQIVVEPYVAATALLPIGLPPTFVSVYGTYAISPLRERWPAPLLFARGLRQASSVVCASRFTQDLLLERLKLDNTVILNLGHDFPLDGHERSVGDDGRLEGSPIVVGVGALKRRKGYHVALRAIARLRERFPNLRYYLVGDDSDLTYVAELRADIARLGLDDYAVITGKVSDGRLRSIYRQADLFVLTPVNVGPSFEGFGIVYLEAGAYGKPVVGSHGCGAEDAVHDAVTGLLAPQEDDQAVAECVSRILGDPELAARLGQAGRARAEAQTWTAVAGRYVELYQRALRG
jgi:glycosyltransferase involved in cell wall biosynthesis